MRLKLWSEEMRSWTLTLIRCIHLDLEKSAVSVESVLPSLFHLTVPFLFFHSKRQLKPSVFLSFFPKVDPHPPQPYTKPVFYINPIATPRFHNTTAKVRPQLLKSHQVLPSHKAFKASYWNHAPSAPHSFSNRWASDVSSLHALLWMRCVVASECWNRC